MTTAARGRDTRTGGRAATTRHIPPTLALAVGMPTVVEPRGWRWRPLSELARLESGHTPSRQHSEYWGGDVPWISIPDAKRCHGGVINDTEESTNALGIANSSARLIPAGAVCLSRTASVGYVAITGRSMATSQDFVNWICGDQLLPEFLQHLFIAEGENLLRFASGAVHKTIYFPEVKAFHVCVPDVAAQRRIVAILDEAFEAIATAKANAEKNLQNARELGQLLRDNLFSRIASHAERRSLGEICTFVRGPFGGSLKKEVFVEDGYAVYEQSHAIYDQFSDVRYFVDETRFSEMRRFELRPNDLIMSCSGTMGRVAIAPYDLRRGIINQALLKLTPGASVDSWYLKYWMESGDFQDALGQRSGGAAIQNVASVSILKEIALPLPALAAQQAAVVEIDRFAAETERLHENYQQKLAALEELKKSLLHQAFSGQLSNDQ